MSDRGNPNDARTYPVNPEKNILRIYATSPLSSGLNLCALSTAEMTA